VSGEDFYRIGQQKAARRAVLAGMDAASNTLEATVTRQYLAALRARDAVELARQELERAEANLSLAEARYAVRATTVIEPRQAEVERGRAEVALLRAEADYDTGKLRLLQQIGLDLDRDVELTTEVRVFEPQWDLSSLRAVASASQPDLVAARASTESAEAGIGIARSAFWPSLSISTGLSGFTRRAGSDQFLIDQARQSVDAERRNCVATNELLRRLNPPMPPQDCSQILFTEQMHQDIVASNRQFPFDFDREPFSVSLGLSLPIFQGLTRQRQLEAAHAQAEDTRLQARAEELRIHADVETAYLNLETAYRAAILEDRNRGVADDQLRLARERYRVGSASFIELLEAETLKARADRDYLLGVYDFQEALTALEAAVGQRLAVPEN
jgi:outer membrane protein